MSCLQITNSVQRGSRAVADGEILTPGSIGSGSRRAPKRSRKYNQHGVVVLTENVDDYGADDEGSNHIDNILSLPREDIQSLGDLQSAAAVPSLLYSQSSSSSVDELTMDSWIDAADVPTRPTSSISQEFPPLTRCPRKVARNSTDGCDRVSLGNQLLTNTSYFPPDDLTPKRRIHPESKEGRNELVDAGRNESDSCVLMDTGEDVPLYLYIKPEDIA
jgi:hypothetical protein